MDLGTVNSIPLSLNQERILFLRMAAQRNSVEPPPSLLRFAMKLRGEVKAESIRQAVTEIVRRHSALRTVVSENLVVPPPERERRYRDYLRTGAFHPGLFVHSIKEVTDVSFTMLDLSRHYEAQQDTAIRDLLRMNDVRSFSQGEAPRIRAHLLRINKDEYALILFIDHLVCDGLSLPIIRNELGHLIRLEAGERSNALPQPGIAFEKFVAWQNKTLATSYFDLSIKYWRDQWARFASARLGFDDLTFALPPPAKPNFTFRTEYKHLSKTDSEAVRNFSRQSKTTLFVVFLAGLSLALRKESGKKAVGVWCHLANRVQPETITAVGHYPNTHLLGIDVSENLTGTEFLNMIRDTVAEALFHQELPLPHLWRVLGCTPRFPDAAILLDIRIVPKRPVGNIDKLSTVDATPMALPDSLLPRFSNLGVYVFDDGEHISISVQYAECRFKSSGIERLLDNLWDMVGKLLRAPGARVLGLNAELPSRNARQDGSGPMGEFLVLKSNLIPSVPLPAGQQIKE